MRRLLSAAIVSLSLILGTASAASAQGWTGFYIGAHVGFGFNAPTATSTEIDGFWNFFDPVTDIDDVRGGLNFGGLVGIQRTVADRFVVGGEFGIGLNRYSGDGRSGPGDDTHASYQGGLQWTALARAGYTFNNVTPYFTAGVLGLRTSVELEDDCDTGSCGGGLIFASNSGSKSSFVWGLGAEFAMGDRPWSIRAEWLRHDFRTVIDATAVEEDFEVTWRFNPHIPQGSIRVIFTYRVGG
jgi:opacity protein-like surface antigen